MAHAQEGIMERNCYPARGQWMVIRQAYGQVGMALVFGTPDGWYYGVEVHNGARRLVRVGVARSWDNVALPVAISA
jgi:hypothetical protein